MSNLWCTARLCRAMHCVADTPCLGVHSLAHDKKRSAAHSSTPRTTLHSVYKTHTAMNAPQRSDAELFHFLLSSNEYLRSQLTSQLSSSFTLEQIGLSLLGNTKDDWNRPPQDPSRSPTSTPDSSLPGMCLQGAHLQVESDLRLRDRSINASK